MSNYKQNLRCLYKTCLKFIGILKQKLIFSYKRRILRKTSDDKILQTPPLLGGESVSKLFLHNLNPHHSALIHTPDGGYCNYKQNQTFSRWIKLSS